MILAAVVVLMAVTGAQAQIVRLATPGGTPFAIVGKKPAKPAPTLLIFAGSIEQTLDEKFYPLATRLKQERGFLLVTLDLPGHGADHREGEPASIAAWRTRMEKGERVIENFTAKISPILDYLVAEGYADPARIVAAGTSRGGFMAFHAAAADSRIKAVMAFAPVTDLPALSEFSGVRDQEGVRALAVENLAPRLAGRPIWICIGNHDTRVGTDRAIRFTRRVVECAVAAGKRPDIELWVQPSEGHQIAPDSDEKAAAWLATRIFDVPAGGR